jgi:hypothetical protein
LPSLPACRFALLARSAPPALHRFGIIHSYQAGEYLHIEKVLYFHPDYMIFGPMDLNVAVKTAGNGTLLTVRQDGYQSGPEWDWYYQAVLTAWPEAIKLVKKYCER